MVNEPLIRVWPWRTEDPIPAELTESTKLEMYVAPVWVKKVDPDKKDDPRLHATTQQLVAAAACADDKLPDDLAKRISGSRTETTARGARDENRYKIGERRNLVDFHIAEKLCGELLEKRSTSVEWSGVLSILFGLRFPRQWTGLDQPNLNMHLWVPLDSPLGHLIPYASELGQCCSSGNGNFAGRATWVAMTAAANMLSAMYIDAEYDKAEFFASRFVLPSDDELIEIGAFPSERELQGLGGWRTEIVKAMDLYRQTKLDVQKAYRLDPTGSRPLYIAIDGGGTRSTVVVHPPADEQRVLKLGIPVTGAESRQAMAAKVDLIAAEIAANLADIPDRKQLRTVIAIGAAAGSPGELRHLKPHFRRAFQQHLGSFDRLLIMNDADIVGVAERLGPQHRNPETARPVMTLIIGTGSVLVGQKPDGSYLRLDGEQWVASDTCSGTELSRLALKEALTHYQLDRLHRIKATQPSMWVTLGLNPPGTDEHGDRAVLVRELLEHYGHNDVPALVNDLAMDFTKGDLASAGRVVAELADDGNTAATRLVSQIAKNAANLITVAQTWFEDCPEPALTIIGSLAGNCVTWQQSFVRHLWEMQRVAHGKPLSTETINEKMVAGFGDDLRVSWDLPGIAVTRIEGDAATIALRLARRLASTETEAFKAIGDCAHELSYGSTRHHPISTAVATPPDSTTESPIGRTE